MSRVSEFPEEEGRKIRGGTGDGGDNGEQVSKLPKLSFGGRISEFYQSIKLELRKTTWPTRNEVWSTTTVVLIAVFFFGFYLWGVDKLVAMGFEYLEKAIR